MSVSANGLADVRDDRWVVIDDAADWSTLTPLGPGGRPFARWRPLVALLAVATLLALVGVMLSDRAPGILSDVSDEVAVRVEDRSPEAAEARARLEGAVAGTPAEERDVQGHIALWAAATFLLGLTAWSWRSLIGMTVLIAVAATTLELTQERLAPSRITEQSDLVANAAGILVGVVAVVAVSMVLGAPSILRRLSRR